MIMKKAVTIARTFENCVTLFWCVPELDRVLKDKMEKILFKTDFFIVYRLYQVTYYLLELCCLFFSVVFLNKLID